MKEFSEFIKETKSVPAEEYSQLLSHIATEGETISVNELVIRVSTFIALDTLERYHAWINKPEEPLV